MNRKMVSAVIYDAVVTQADLHYVGSVTVDLNLLEAANVLPGELVSILDRTNGARLETYVIAGERGSGVLGINGAAAHLVQVGDKVELVSYVELGAEEAATFVPYVINLSDRNSIVSVSPATAVPVAGYGVKKPVLAPEHRTFELAWAGPFPH